MHPSFREGAREGLKVIVPVAVALVPWAIVTGMALKSAGFSHLEAMGMNFIVFAGTAQLGTLPLIVANAPVWIIVVTALVLNLRFLVFSAAIAKGFRNMGAATRWLAGYLLTDGAFIVTLDKMLSTEDRQWRLGHYMAPSALCWLIWQVFGAIGVFAAASIPKNWSLDFMATIALLVLLVPMARSRPMLVAAAAGGLMAVVLRDLPLRLGVIVAIVIGIMAGFAAEKWGKRNNAKGHTA